MRTTTGVIGMLACCAGAACFTAGIAITAMSRDHIMGICCLVGGALALAGFNFCLMLQGTEDEG